MISSTRVYGAVVYKPTITWCIDSPRSEGRHSTAMTSAVSLHPISSTRRMRVAPCRSPIAFLICTGGCSAREESQHDEQRDRHRVRRDARQDERAPGRPGPAAPARAGRRRPSALSAAGSSGAAALAGRDVRWHQEPPRRLCVPRRAGNGDRSAARAKAEQVELPLFRVSEIIVASSGISISTDLIEECCERGIHLSFLTPGGRPLNAALGYGCIPSASGCPASSSCSFSRPTRAIPSTSRTPRVAHAAITAYSSGHAPCSRMTPFAARAVDGFIYLVPEKRIVPLGLTEGDRAGVRQALADIRRMIEREALPDPTPVRARCSACEFQNYCGDIW